MQKFAQEQNADLKMNNIVEAKLPIDTIKDVIETVKKVDDLKDVIEYVPQKDANESVPKVDSILNENVVHELVNKVVEKKD